MQNTSLKYAFSILNNGITIVAEKIGRSRENVTITNYQIINGLQTSRVLRDSKNELNNKIFVPLKLIITQDENLIAKIIRSTNRQTEVKEEDLIAYSDFQKKLEDYYKTFEDPYKLYYERRSKQYNNNHIIDRKLIIDKSTQIKVMGSFFFMKPNLATRYFGALFAEFGKELFKEEHKLHPYYSAALTFNILENLFRNNLIDHKFKKLRYFILMMIRLEIDKESCPSFESKKSEAYCNKILNIVKNESDFISIINKIIVKLEKLSDSFDFNSSEVSKSHKLVQDCKSIYFK